eukprot:COSAG01_NODE_2145_length_8304_cov_162.380256_4_plen_278_part_00
MLACGVGAGAGWDLALNHEQVEELTTSRGCFTQQQLGKMEAAAALYSTYLAPSHSVAVALNETLHGDEMPLLDEHDEASPPQTPEPPFETAAHTGDTSDDDDDDNDEAAEGAGERARAIADLDPTLYYRSGPSSSMMASIPSASSPSAAKQRRPASAAPAFADSSRCPGPFFSSAPSRFTRVRHQPLAYCCLCHSLRGCRRRAITQSLRVSQRSCRAFARARPLRPHREQRPLSVRDQQRLAALELADQVYSRHPVSNAPLPTVAMDSGWFDTWWIP